MELLISVKGHKYSIQDKQGGKLLYTVKKKGFSSKYLLLDASEYQLYTMTKTSEDRKPVFIISHNDKPIISLSCKSLFLDPTIDIKGKDNSGTPVEYALASKEHKDFTLLAGEKEMGELHTLLTVDGELQYEMKIDNKIFDDYLPLFAVAVDLTFGEMNKGS